MARILVTGSEGFIGKHLIHALHEHEVIGCDLGTKELTGPFDGIIHLAAVSRVRDAEIDRIKCLETNIVFTAQMLEWKPDWFIFSSTCEPPENVYGFSKWTAEQYVELVANKSVILKLTNVYGPGMAEDKLLPRLARGEIKKLNEGVLPFEHIHVKDVVAQIVGFIPTFNEPCFKSFKMKLCTGIAKTQAELLNVATSY